MIKYKHTFFLVASEAEISKVTNQDDLYSLLDVTYENCGSGSGFGGFEMVFELSWVFFQDEKHIPKEIDANIPDVSRIFQYKKDFVDKIISLKKEEMDPFIYQLKEGKFCKRINFVGFGLWNSMFVLHNCCTFAANEDKNLYLIEEEDEYISER